MKHKSGFVLDNVHSHLILHFPKTADSEFFLTPKDYESSQQLQIFNMLSDLRNEMQVDASLDEISQKLRNSRNGDDEQVPTPRERPRSVNGVATTLSVRNIFGSNPLCDDDESEDESDCELFESKWKFFLMDGEEYWLMMCCITDPMYTTSSLDEKSKLWSTCSVISRDGTKKIIERRLPNIIKAKRRELWSEINKFARKHDPSRSPNWVDFFSVERLGKIFQSKYKKKLPIKVSRGKVNFGCDIYEIGLSDFDEGAFDHMLLPWCKSPDCFSKMEMPDKYKNYSATGISPTELIEFKFENQRTFDKSDLQKKIEIWNVTINSNFFLETMSKSHKHLVKYMKQKKISEGSAVTTEHRTVSEFIECLSREIKN